MSKKTEKTNKPGKPVPLNIPPEMDAEISAIAEKRGQTKAWVMREAIKLGMDAVDKMFERPAAKAA